MLQWLSQAIRWLLWRHPSRRWPPRKNPLDRHCSPTWTPPSPRWTKLLVAWQPSPCQRAASFRPIAHRTPWPGRRPFPRRPLRSWPIMSDPDAPSPATGASPSPGISRERNWPISVWPWCVRDDGCRGRALRGTDWYVWSLWSLLIGSWGWRWSRCCLIWRFSLRRFAHHEPEFRRLCKNINILSNLNLLSFLVVKYN